jgi:hypothetical protein
MRRQWDRMTFVHVDTPVALRDRAASIRWVASTERLHNEAKALVALAEQLEAQAFLLENNIDKQQMAA